MKELNGPQSNLLEAFRSRKASARKGYFAELEPNENYENICNELVELEYLKRSKAGSISMGKNGYLATGTKFGDEAKARRQLWDID